MAAVGFIILAIAALTTLTMGLANSGSDHLIDDFSMFGATTTASSGRIFIYGAISGLVGAAGATMIYAGIRHRVTVRRRNRQQKPEAPLPLSQTIQQHPEVIAVDEVDARDATGQRLTH